MKILVWDGTGLVLVYKRLDEGRFAWPFAVASGRSDRWRNRWQLSNAWRRDGSLQDGVMRLTRAQFEALFEG